MKNFQEWMLMSQLPKEGIFIRGGKKVIICNSCGDNTRRSCASYNKSIYNSRCTMPNDCTLGMDLYYKEVTNY